MVTTFETESLTRLHWIGIVLAALTGIVHLYFGVLALDTLQGASFVLAGIAFFVAIGLLLLDVRRPLLYLAGIPFTGVQVVLYFYLNWPNVLSPGGIGDKVVQVALIAILVILYRRESAAAASAAR
ncbi:hypothetical protein DU504_07615 [Haloplanus salinus]|jgi:hypothetical protein|uniref:Uncharacterized protein n=1 Tax=Haloplanus salinus TaxID=1126245 RepID=A0A368NA99_9EURY|nr:hypothetical protein [Haloplanus salinus]RCU47176.1 hypothetical protein DU504_07615 [Haloplanus salinus]